MPASPGKPCRLTAVKKISFGQSGVEIDTDLQTLFAMLNSLARCVGKIADYLEAQPASSFAGGSSSGSGSGGSPLSSGSLGNPGNGASRGMTVERFSTGSNFTVPDGFAGTLYVDATANITVTLCSPNSGFTITVAHAGAAPNTITVKKADGTTIATLISGGVMPISPVENNSNQMIWPSFAIAYYPLGAIVAGSQNLVFDAGAGPCVLDAATNLWQIGFANTGALNTTNVGLSISSAIPAGFPPP